jgi:soluble lytic murein transglycosylase-like protein
MAVISLAPFGYTNVSDVADQVSQQIEYQSLPNSPRDRDVAQFLFEYNIELEFWLEVIPNKELVYQVVDSRLGVPRSLVFALVATESQFVSHAVGRNPVSKDYGLFQLNSVTYSAYSVTQLLDENVNISLGLKHLYDEMKRFDWDMELAVKAYNAGPYRVRKGTEPESTKRYSQKVLTQKENYDIMFKEFRASFGKYR